MTVAVHLDRQIVAVKPGSALDLNFGLAVDVGTTTLVMDLVDLDSGKTLDTEAALNSQVRRGADVISRITYVYGDPGKAAELRDLLLGTLNEMIGRLLGRKQVPPDSVHEVVISGNTVMSHLLLGVPVDTLATAPYHAVFSRAPVAFRLRGRAGGQPRRPGLFFAQHHELCRRGYLLGAAGFPDALERRPFPAHRPGDERGDRP